MTHSWLVLLPPFIVLLSAIITRHLNVSLLFGIISAAFIATDFSLLDAGLKAFERFFATVTDIENLQMYSFLFMISILIVLLNRTGGAAAFAHIVIAKLRTKKAAETSSLILSSTLFIDDYLGCLTVGYIMRPITDALKIPRAKLAYLVHTMTGPLVILAPISSWVAAITAMFDQSGVSTTHSTQTLFLEDPFFMYIQTIPYIFYSFITLSAIWFIVRKQISFGPMNVHEHIAQTTNNLFGGKVPLADPLTEENMPQGKLSDLLIPLIALIGTVFIGTLWTGDYYLFGGSHSLLEAFKSNTKIFLVLFISGIVSLAVSFGLAFARNSIKLSQTWSIIKDGIMLIASAVLMVMLASVLSKMLQHDLKTGQYLAYLLKGILSLWLLPCLLFIVTTITGMLIGSAWGTMMLLIPIALQMIITLTQAQTPINPDAVAILFPALGAIFSGAVCGDHLSPISSVTIMAATSSGSYPIDHTITQFAYGIPVIIFTAIAFLLAGIFADQSIIFKLIIPMLFGIFSCCLTLWVLDYFKKR
jgi:tetracycline resistance efflux pump